MVLSFDFEFSTLTCTFLVYNIRCSIFNHRSLWKSKVFFFILQARKTTFHLRTWFMALDFCLRYAVFDNVDILVGFYAFFVLTLCSISWTSKNVTFIKWEEMKITVSYFTTNLQLNKPLFHPLIYVKAKIIISSIFRSLYRYILTWLLVIYKIIHDLCFIVLITISSI